MVITHDGDWSCGVTQASRTIVFFFLFSTSDNRPTFQYDSLPDAQEFVANILADLDIYQENGQIVCNVRFMDYPNFYYLRKTSFSYSQSI